MRLTCVHSCSCSAKKNNRVRTLTPSSQDALQGLHSLQLVVLHSGFGVTEQSSPLSPNLKKLNVDLKDVSPTQVSLAVNSILHCPLDAAAGSCKERVLVLRPLPQVTLQSDHDSQLVTGHLELNAS